MSPQPLKWGDHEDNYDDKKSC